MPLQNRVTPRGELIATPARGAWTGNRGCLHDAAKRIRRRWTVRRWIICRLEFKSRHRHVMAPGRYTELFFLDEATALAAGHRPCFECRRADAQGFAEAWRRAAGGKVDADAMDTVLHRQRWLSRQSLEAPAPVSATTLPEGAIVERAGRDGLWLVTRGNLWRWTPAGYETRDMIEAEAVRLVTPRAVVAVLSAGYRPQLHPSVLR